MRATAGLLAAAALLVGAAHGASASEQGIVITAVPSPVWVSGHPMDVHYVVRNARTQLACDKLNVTLTWYEEGSRPRSVIDSEPAAMGVYSGAVRLPSLVKGTVHYRLSASQYCGFFDHGMPYVGSTSWTTARVV